MRALLQRAGAAAVAVDSETIGRIGQGWLVWLGVGLQDTAAVAAALAEQVALLRGRGFRAETGRFGAGYHPCYKESGQ